MSEKQCPFCEFVGLFKAFGSPPRWYAECPSCGSLERHRLLGLLLQRRKLILDGAVVLHFAPESCIAALIKQRNVQYVSADLHNKGVDRNLNIESIELPDRWCDVVLCNHALEHVNDKAAMSELWRILKPDGNLIAMVPISEGCDHTYEDPTITDTHGREVHFGQYDYDHVRVYGRDFVQRLKYTGFQVEIFTAFGVEAVRYGLNMGE